MKNRSMFSRIGVAMVIALLISSVQHSFAAGTTAGTAITNTASVTFNDGANVKNKTSNTCAIPELYGQTESFLKRDFSASYGVFPLNAP